MSLIIIIKENDTIIRSYGATRVDEKQSGENLYTVKSYEIASNEKGRRQMAIRPKMVGSVRHTYEDGADVLAKKILELIIFSGDDKRVFNCPCPADENGVCSHRGKCEYQVLPLHGVPPRQSCLMNEKFYKEYYG